MAFIFKAHTSNARFLNHSVFGWNQNRIQENQNQRILPGIGIRNLKKNAGIGIGIKMYPCTQNVSLAHES